MQKLNVNGDFIIYGQPEILIFFPRGGVMKVQFLEISEHIYLTRDDLLAVVAPIFYRI